MNEYYERAKMEDDRLALLLPLLKVVKPFLSDFRAPTLTVTEDINDFFTVKFALITSSSGSISAALYERHHKQGHWKKTDWKQVDFNMYYWDKEIQTLTHTFIPIIPQTDTAHSLILSQKYYKLVTGDWDNGNTLQPNWSTWQRNATLDEIKKNTTMIKDGEFDAALTEKTLLRFQQTYTESKLINADNLLEANI